MKKMTSFVLALVLIFGLVGCNTKSMNYIIENKPNVTGIVKEVHGDYIIMYAEAAQGYPNGSSWSISLDVENKDSYTDVVVGDEIVVYHDGNVMESDPLQVGTVYAITLKTPANRAVNNEPSVSEETATVGGELISMVMINGTLYCDTGEKSTVTAKCGVMDGQITSTIAQNQTPTENDQSNFGTGYGYQYGPDGTVEIFIDDVWWVFAIMADAA